METVSVLNLKGGVGKTTCAVNLAAAAAERGTPALLIDLDPQSSATDHLMAIPDSGGIADVLLGRADLSDVVVERSNRTGEGAALSLVPSGGFQLNAAEVSLQARGSKNRLRVVLQNGSSLESTFDVAFVDTGPGLDFLWYNALYASDIVLCPVELQMAALQGLRRFHELLEFAKEEDGLRPNVYYIPTNNDGRLRESRDLLGVLIDQYGEFPRGRVLPSVRYSSAFSKAYAQRLTVMEFAPRGRGSRDCSAVVEAILSIQS